MNSWMPPRGGGYSGGTDSTPPSRPPVGVPASSSQRPLNIKIEHVYGKNVVPDATTGPSAGYARRFLLHRTKDDTGISGTGVVAEGIEFSDGTVVLRWIAVRPGTDAHKQGVVATTALHDDITSVIALHGHGGATTVRWVD